jgi:endonuclease G, mitochondrial
MLNNLRIIALIFLFSITACDAKISVKEPEPETTPIITTVRDDLCLYSCPYKDKTAYELLYGQTQNNTIVDHQILILSQNKETKFADWISYKVTPENINADVQTNRYWRKDPKLDQEHVLIPSDYDGAYAKCNYDRGHQAPLASFKGADWKKTNYVSNITPQKADLNRGPWLKLENAVRKLVNAKNKPVYVITGTYYDKKGREEQNALCQLETQRIEYQIPRGYWKLVALEEEGKLKVASFIFNQAAQRKDSHCDYISDLTAVEGESGFKFFIKGDHLNDRNFYDSIESASIFEEMGCNSNN